jgi:hypothetical protein
MRFMSRGLVVAEVVRCYFDEAFDPPLPAMCLRWDPETAGPSVQSWDLPEGIRLTGPAPGHFGVRIHRQETDCYMVRLLWERTCFLWLSLKREQLLASSLAPVLHALGTDLLYLLDQPVEPTGPLSPRAA